LEPIINGQEGWDEPNKSLQKEKVNPVRESKSMKGGIGRDSDIKLE
jgi:hypothetical protein